MSEQLATSGARELVRRITACELSPVELLEECLARIRAYNGRLNAVVTLSRTALEQAREIERRLERGEEAGPLAGLPVGIKDVTPVAGLRHTYGSALYADHVAEHDALVVQRLRDAGAVILGKTNTPEFATGGNTFNEVFGVTRNPWNPRLSAGGSTGGGAAALASGMIALAEGTDLGGSLRIPASFCGVVGLRPTPGLVPTWPSDYPYDTMQVTGLMGRRAEDVALALDAVAGPSPLAPVGQVPDLRPLLEQVDETEPTGLRIAWCEDIAGIGVDARIASVCREALDALAAAGAQVEEIEFDLSWAREAFLILRGFWMVTQHRGRLEQRDRFGDNLRGNIEAGLKLGARDFAAAEQTRGEVWDRFRKLFAHFDFLATPTMAVPPFPAEENYPATIAGRAMETYVDWIAPTFLLSLPGLPVASVPAGLDESGLPVGMQLVAPPAGEGRALGVAARVQEARDIGVPRLERSMTA